VLAEQVEQHVGNDIDEDDSTFWEDLQQLSWCPVVTAPPHSDMPFPTASPSLPPFAPPRMARLVSCIYPTSLLKGTDSQSRCHPFDGIAFSFNEVCGPS
jgi:hypothetical protein